jgi:zinc protease
MAGRFLLPDSGASTPVRFPAMASATLANGLAVRTIPLSTLPVVSAMLVILRGTSDDPADRHGLASLTGDLVDEGAGSLDAIELAEAFARIGAEFSIDVGPDATILSTTALERHFDAALGLVADIAIRPRLAEADFNRVRELRLSRLGQLGHSAGTIADRAYMSAVFGSHPYGHGALGTTAALEAITLADARGFWETMYGPHMATLIVGGAVEADSVVRAADRVFGGWSGPDQPPPAIAVPPPSPNPRILLVDRPRAPQSEVRIGHIGPDRATDAYHALVTLNALLGGQFTSRINKRLREQKGVTYGARSSFDFRRAAGVFSCETSVQGDRTAEAVADLKAELEDVRRQGAISTEELVRAKDSLTRGYVRHFETAGQFVRAAAQLVTYALPDDTFDRFVTGVEDVSLARIQTVAERFVRPGGATTVVVGDALVCRAPLEALGRAVEMTKPEF